jgi:hypothetical protein
MEPMSARAILLLALGLALASGVSHADGQGGSTALPFFTDALDPARAAQGGAFCAASRDAASLFANPAGLAGARSEAFVAHAELGSGLQLEGAAVSVPLRGSAGTLSFGAGYAHLAGLVARDEQGNDLAGSLTYGALLVRAAYARELGGGLSAAVSAEYLGQQIAGESGNGFGGGAGLLYRGRRFELSGSVAHAGPALKSGSGAGERLPMDLRAGASVHPVPELDLSAEWSQVRGAPGRLGGGAAYLVAGVASVRLGYRHDLAAADGVSGLTAGLGVGHGTWSADYGFIQESGVGPVHRFGLRIGFGTSTAPSAPAPNAPPR